MSFAHVIETGKALFEFASVIFKMFDFQIGIYSKYSRDLQFISGSLFLALFHLFTL